VTGIYLVGYVILMGGVFAALWQLDVLATVGTVGTVWTAIGVIIAVGIGIMLAVSSSGTKKM